jgi:hypothetical protein
MRERRLMLRVRAQVAHPGQVHLLRGNHEIREVNELSYDFLKHCRSRLGAHGCSTRLGMQHVPARSCVTAD